jgi:hypothetical protein
MIAHISQFSVRLECRKNRDGSPNSCSEGTDRVAFDWSMRATLLPPNTGDQPAFDVGDENSRL